MEWIRVLLVWLVLLQVNALRVDSQELDSSLIVVTARLPRTPKTLEYVHQALAWLPGSLKERLLKADFPETFRLVQSLRD